MKAQIKQWFERNRDWLETMPLIFLTGFLFVAFPAVLTLASLFLDKENFPANFASLLSFVKPVGLTTGLFAFVWFAVALGD
jgi:hypothetical protein